MVITKLNNWEAWTSNIAAKNWSLIRTTPTVVQCKRSTGTTFPVPHRDQPLCECCPLDPEPVTGLTPNQASAAGCKHWIIKRTCKFKKLNDPALMKLKFIKQFTVFGIYENLNLISHFMFTLIHSTITVPTFSDNTAEDRFQRSQFSLRQKQDCWE